MLDGNQSALIMSTQYDEHVVDFLHFPEQFIELAHGQIQYHYPSLCLPISSNSISTF